MEKQILPKDQKKSEIQKYRENRKTGNLGDSTKNEEVGRIQIQSKLTHRKNGRNPFPDSPIFLVFPMTADRKFDIDEIHRCRKNKENRKKQKNRIFRKNRKFSKNRKSGNSGKISRSGKIGKFTGSVKTGKTGIPENGKMSKIPIRLSQGVIRKNRKSGRFYRTQNVLTI